MKHQAHWSSQGRGTATTIRSRRQHSNRQRNKQTNKQTNNQTGKQISKQASKQPRTDNHRILTKRASKRAIETHNNPQVIASTLSQSAPHAKYCCPRFIQQGIKIILSWPHQACWIPTNLERYLVHLRRAVHKTLSSQ